MTTHTLDRAVEASAIIAALKHYGVSQGDVAQATGVSTRSVRVWAKEGTLRRNHEEALQALRQIVLALDDSLSPRGVGQWLRAHNRSLGGERPIDVLHRGDIEAVRRAAEAFAEGAYV